MPIPNQVGNDNTRTSKNRHLLLSLPPSITVIHTLFCHSHVNGNLYTHQIHNQIGNDNMRRSETSFYCHSRSLLSGNLHTSQIPNRVETSWYSLQYVKQYKGHNCQNRHDVIHNLTLKHRCLCLHI